MGAGAIIDLKQPDADVHDAFVRESGGGYDVILDFLWGHPAIAFSRRRSRLTRLVLPSIEPATFRSGQAAGAQSFRFRPKRCARPDWNERGGQGSIEALPQALEQIWTWVREEGKLTMDIEKVDLSCVTRSVAAQDNKEKESSSCHRVTAAPGPGTGHYLPAHNPCLNAEGRCEAEFATTFAL